MNVLAHALLAGNDAGLRLGGVMGDFVRGTPDESLPVRVRDGIYLHRAIDGYTDTHPLVRKAREAMPPPFRRYAGIFLDVWFDHCLARDFASYCPTPLEAFSDNLRAEMHAADAILPDGLKRFLLYMDAHELPAGYADLERVAAALGGLSRRLSRANPVGESVPLLIEHDAMLRETFAAFFPQLQAFAANWVAAR
ncbi:ACP phosphodiesterase [Luteibacter aegosomaticola]|uniref:acyl carrier protein phosphodiesterase n=1 Tax=Luteibacter aegosomaticola TaxID=2911538 RepID=UPI001FFC05E1|nr:ACP phosphodiesterase [Luteibacter aegosomaticola]UPG89824.1 ACP phosphodiesterase [Luteibacter aegosomaticola]